MYPSAHTVHEESKDDNDDCFQLMFGPQCFNLWQGLKNLYVCTSSII